MKIIIKLKMVICILVLLVMVAGGCSAQSKDRELDSAEAYKNQGNEYFSKGDYDSAIAAYTRAIEIDPKYTAPYNNRGLAYENKGDYDRAIADLTRAIELDQNFREAYYSRGNVYSRKGEYDRAIADLTRAIEVDPNYAAAYYHRGIAYEAKGDRQRAKEDFAVEQKLTVSVWDNIGAHQSVKNLRLVELGAIEESPNSFDYILYKAASYAIQGDEAYSQDDYYYYPLEEWNDEKLLDGVNQVLNSYTGYSPKYPLENMSLVDICNLFELFHYSFLNFEEIAANMYRFNFRHKVYGDMYTVYLKNNEPQDMSITELYFLMSVESTLIKMCEYKNGIIKILTEDHDLGIDAEYAWIYFRYPEYERTLQTLAEINSSGQFEILASRKYNKTPPTMKWNGQGVKVKDDTYYDILTIENGDDTKDIVFDISDFFHSPMKGEDSSDDDFIFGSGKGACHRIGDREQGRQPSLPSPTTKPTPPQLAARAGGRGASPAECIWNSLL